jgi:signal peptidase II
MHTTKAIVKRILMLGAALSIVGCDQVTKQLATQTLSGEPTRSYFLDVVRLTYAENTGAFLSLGGDLPGSVRYPVFVLAGLMLLLLVVYAVRARWTGWRLLGLTLFVSGGLSNFADRLAYGRVVDFLNVGIGPIRTGIFNIADIALLAGCAVLALSELPSRPRGPDPTADK